MLIFAQVAFVGFVGALMGFLLAHLDPMAAAAVGGGAAGGGLLLVHCIYLVATAETGTPPAG